MYVVVMLKGLSGSYGIIDSKAMERDERNG